MKIDQDPVDEGSEEAEEARLTRDMEASEGELQLEEIGSAPPSAARVPHPFEGYPLGRVLPIGEAKISATHLVILKNPDIFQDPSGNNVAHEVFVKDKRTGKDIKAEDADGRYKKAKVEKRTTINIKTSWSVVVLDYDQSGSGVHTDIVFDREVSVSGKMMTCAVVRSHSVRAQLIFMMSKGRGKSRMVVNPLYILADKGQIGPLRRVFQNVNYQQLKGERAAQKFDADPGK